MADDLWRWLDNDGVTRTYRLVNPEIVSYARDEKRVIDGRKVVVKLPPLEFTIVTAVPVGNEGQRILDRRGVRDLD